MIDLMLRTKIVQFIFNPSGTNHVTNLSGFLNFYFHIIKGTIILEQIILPASSSIKKLSFEHCDVLCMALYT